MNILFVLNHFHGGATQGILEFLASLQPGQVKAYAIAPSMPREHKAKELDAVFEEWKVVNMPWWNRSANQVFYKRIAWDVIHWWRGTRKNNIATIKSLCAKWDVDLVYSGTIMTIEGALAAKELNLPHIWHMKATFASKGRLQFPMSDEALFDLLISHSDRVFVMTDYIKSHFLDRVDDPKIIKVKDGVNVDQFTYNKKEAKATLCAKYQLSTEEPLIGMAANFGSLWKNHQLFIEVAREVVKTMGKSHYKFIAFGIVPPRREGRSQTPNRVYYEGLQQKVVQYGLEDNIIWGGFYNNIPEMMGGLDILFHPCAQEPFGRISIESMAAGTPVVGPVTGGIGEAVTDGETGVLRAGDDVKGLAEGVVRLIEDANFYEHCSEQGPKFVREEYAQQEQTEFILDILKQISEERKQG